MARTLYCIPCATGTRPTQTVATREVDDDPMCDFHAAEILAERGKELEPKPASKTCVPCKVENVVTRADDSVDDVPMCRKHLSEELLGGVPAKEVRFLPDDGLCPRGCGRPRHRGLCGSGAARRNAVVRSNPRRPSKRASAAASAVASAAFAAHSFPAPKVEKVGDVSIREIQLSDIPKPSIKVSLSGMFIQWLTSGKESALEVACRDIRHVNSVHHVLKKSAKRKGVKFWWARVDKSYVISSKQFEGGQQAWQ